MKKYFAIIALLGLGFAPMAHADETDKTATADTTAVTPAKPGLADRVQALEEELVALSSTAASSAPTLIGYGDPVKGVGFTTADGTYGIKLSGVLQVDDRTYFYGGVNQKGGETALPSDEVLLGRARYQVDAQLGPKVSLRYQQDLSPSFGGFAGTGSVLDAYGQVKLAPWSTVRVGLFKTPLDLERQRDTNAGDFVQYGYTAALVTDRDAGAWVEFGDPKGIIYAGGGVFNGSVDTGNPVATEAYNNDLAGVSKVFVQPFVAGSSFWLKRLGLGVAGSAGDNFGQTIATYKSLGQQTLQTIGGSANALTPTIQSGQSEAYRIVPQAYWFVGPASAIAEYVQDDQDAQYSPTTQGFIRNEAWDLSLGWWLTGDKAMWQQVTLNGNSRPWGALQVVARVEGADYAEGQFTAYSSSGTVLSKGFFDPRTSVSSLTSWSVGLNYVPVNNVKVLISWDQTFFADGASAVVGGNTIVQDRAPEQILDSRVQFYF